MGAVSSAIDLLGKAASFSFGYLTEQRLDFVMGNGCCGNTGHGLQCVHCLQPSFNMDLQSRPEVGAGKDSATIMFSTSSIVDAIYRHLEATSLLSFRSINKLSNLQACKQLQDTCLLESNLTCDADIDTFLQTLKNVGPVHPFTDLVVDLWGISLETTLDLSRDLGWIRGLNLLGVSTGMPSPKEFILKEISTKVGVLLHGAPFVESLSVKTNFEVCLSGILELLLPTEFPNLNSLFIHVLQLDPYHRGDFLDHVISRAPTLTSVGIILPEDDHSTCATLGCLRQAPLQNVSLTTPISMANLQSLRDCRLRFCSLRLRLKCFENDAFCEDFYSWLSTQSESLVTLGLTIEIRNSIESNWTLPALKSLEVLSILVIGSNSSTILCPFFAAQFSKLTAFAYVQSGAKMTILAESVFPNITAFGFSGQNGPLEETLASNLPNLKHITLCGVSNEHLATVFTKFPKLIELVMIFEGAESDMWTEITGGIPRSWEEFFDELFGNVEISDSLTADWSAISGQDSGTGDSMLESRLFLESLEGLEASTRMYSDSKDPRPCLASMKCRLEYLKFIGWNSSAFEGLVHLTANDKLSKYSHLQIEVPSEAVISDRALEILRGYHTEVIIVNA